MPEIVFPIAAIEYKFIPDMIAGTGPGIRIRTIFPLQFRVQLFIYYGNLYLMFHLLTSVKFSPFGDILPFCQTIRNNGFGEPDREKAAMFMPEKEPCSSLDISTGVVLKYLSLIGGQIILGK